MSETNPFESKCLEIKETIKNPKFLSNCTCPRTGYIANEIWHHKITKIGRDKWDLEWQYYADRNKNSVESVYKKFKGDLFRVTYKGDPREYIYDDRSEEKKVRDEKYKKEAKENRIIKKEEKASKKLIK